MSVIAPSLRITSVIWTESSRMSMLGISLRKYAHFYRLLSNSSLTKAESLFLLHFVVDVQLCKDMP